MPLQTWKVKAHHKYSISTTMATIPQGILGKLKGRVGPVTGYDRYNQTILRSSRNNVVFKQTAARTAQQEKIRITNYFTVAFKNTGFFSKTFPAYGGKGSGYNRATKAIMNQALVGVYPHIHLDYAKVLVAQGKIPAAENAGAVAGNNGNIQFNFTDNSNTGTAAATDKVVLLAYAEALQQVVFNLHAGLRKDGTAILPASQFKGYTVQTWIAFLSNDETNGSDSVYTGSISL